MAMSIPTDLHPDLMPVVWLLGTWHGNGRGEYPGLDPFTFDQEVAIAHDGRPFLHYFSRTWRTDAEGQRSPGELETGFLRVVPSEEPDETAIELVLAHPSGYADVWYGSVEGARLTLATDVVARTVTAEDYAAGQRMYGLVEGDLMYANDMAAMGQPMQSHTWGRLARA
jgi:hypothetical protein